MKKMIRSLLILAALLAGSSSLLAQPAMKLLVVDLAKVLDTYYKSEEQNAKFRADEQRAQEQLEEMNKQGQQLYEGYKAAVEQAKSPMLTAEAKAAAEADVQKKGEEIRQKQQDIQDFRVNTQRSLQQRVKTSRDLLLEEISEKVVGLAKKEGATLVVDKFGPSLLGISNIVYSDPAYDITDKVIAEVNKDRPAPAAPAPAPVAPAATPETKK
jgi:outer membrane protein